MAETDLATVAAEIRAYCAGNNLAVFSGIPNYFTMPQQFMAYWNTKVDGDYKNFILSAEKSGVKMIYLERTLVNKEMATRMGHEGEVAFWTVAFFVNSFFHVMYINSSWWVPPPRKPAAPESPSYA